MATLGDVAPYPDAVEQVTAEGLRRHELFQAALAHRHMRRLVSTNSDALPQLVQRAVASMAEAFLWSELQRRCPEAVDAIAQHLWAILDAAAVEEWLHDQIEESGLQSDYEKLCAHDDAEWKRMNELRLVRD